MIADAPETRTERALLALIIKEPSLLDVALDVGVRSPADFSTVVNGEVFGGMLSLYERGVKIDAEVLAAELAKLPNHNQYVRSDKIAEYVAGFYESPTRENVGEYAAIIADASFQRRADHVVSTELKRIRHPAHNTREVVTALEDQLAELSTAQKAKGSRPLVNIYRERMKAMQERFENRSLITGVPTGFMDLDLLTGGLQNGHLVTVGASSSVGKSAFLMRVAYSAACEGFAVAVFSVEMSGQQLVDRMMATEGRVRGDAIRSGYASDDEYQRLVDLAYKMKELKMDIDDSTELSVPMIAAELRRIRVKRGRIGLVVADYFQLLKPAPTVSANDANARRAQAGTREQEVAGVARALQAAAKQWDCPFVVAAQLNANPDKREQRRPQIEDMRESQAIRHASDEIILLHRPNASDPSQPSNEGEAILAKSRSGGLGIAKLSFIAAEARWESAAR